jgi:RNA-directed DNA polymerase
MWDRGMAPGKQLTLPCAQQRGEASVGVSGGRTPSDEKGLMERVVERPNLLAALARVKTNGGSPGIDGMTVEDLPGHFPHHWPALRTSLLAGTYHPSPVRRVDMPKPGGGVRKLGMPTVADRLLQRAVARILSAMYEPEFLECPFGYRPGRTPHMALKALRDHMVTGKVRYVYEADIQGYFTNINHKWLRQMIALRIADPVITGLIGKWLKAGVMEHGVVARPEAGMPQGGPQTPALAYYRHGDLLSQQVEQRTEAPDQPDLVPAIGVLEPGLQGFDRCVT